MIQAVETEQYKKGLAEIKLPRLDAIVTGLLWAINAAPTDFPTIDEACRLRVIKSEPVGDGSGKSKRVSIYFEHSDGKNKLLTIAALDVPEL